MCWVRPGLREAGQLLLLRQRVDGGGLAGVGAADEGDLGHLQRGQLVELRGGGQKARVCIQPSACRAAGSMPGLGRKERGEVACGGRVELAAIGALGPAIVESRG
jgi:hypothetical protein